MIVDRTGRINGRRRGALGERGADRAGSLAVTDEGNGHIDRITFFTPEKAIATGYVGRDRDEYLRTTDGGESWERLRFDTTDREDGQWIYDVFATPEGDALWVLDEALRISRITASGIELAPPTAEASELLDLRVVRLHGELLLVISAHHIYGSSDGGERWVRWVALGAAADGEDRVLVELDLEPEPSLSSRRRPA